jgi:pullulanase/glycogen debranching enzyme
VLRRRHFFRGAPTGDGEAGPKDVTWIRPDGAELTEADWQNPEATALGMLISGNATDELDDRGHPVLDDTLLIIVSNAPRDLSFRLPELATRGIWAELVNTARPELTLLKEDCIQLLPYSLVLMRFGRDRRMAVEPASRAADVSRGERGG